MTPQWIFYSIIIIMLLLWLFSPLPGFKTPYSVVVLDRSGDLLNASVAADGQWRFPPGRSVPEKYLHAAVLYEDKRFFLHPGVDPLALLRAAWSDVRKGRIVSGGSTLTMQVVRLSRSGKPRTVFEKMVEMIQASRLESFYGKEEILASYAAHAPFGGNVVGLASASWRYFGRQPEQLSWAETAMLTVLPNNPSLIHPGRNRDTLLKKRNGLLDKLEKNGILDSLSCALSKLESLPPEPYPLPVLAPHVYTHLQSDSWSTSPGKGPGKKWYSLPGPVYTTIRKDLQIQADQIIKRYHQRFITNGIHNAAAMIMEVNSGQVLAYIGNVFDPDTSGHDQFVDIIMASRSTGSILKPLLYAGMLQSGDILPTQLVADVPTRMGGFAPQNYSREYQGAVPAYRALARSLNVPAVNMLQKFGVDRFQSLLKNLGMTTLHRPARDYGLTLILGGAEGKLWELTGIYASLARTVNNYFEDHERSGYSFFSPQLLLDEGSNDTGLSLGLAYEENNRNNPLDAGSCWLTLQAMLEVTRPDEEGAWRDFLSGRKIAWKTGTSYGYRDAWAIGVTPRYAVGVWVGNADGEGRPDLVGIKTAAPILFEIFGLLPSDVWFDCPEMDLEQIEVCSRSGFRKGPNCESGVLIQIPPAGVQTAVCPYCQIVHCDRTMKWRVHANCEQIANIVNARWFVLPPVMEWYYIRKHSDYASVPPWRPDCRLSADDNQTHPFSIIYPEKNSVMYIPREIDGQTGRTVFKAAHRNPSALIYWHLDNTYIGATHNVHEMGLAPAPGEHTLTLIDEDGEQVYRKFIIVSGKH